MEAGTIELREVMGDGKSTGDIERLGFIATGKEMMFMVGQPSAKTGLGLLKMKGE